MFGIGFSKGCVYDSNHAILKKYNDSNYKLVFMKNCRLPGFEEQNDTNKGKRNSAGNDFKLDSSLSRTRSSVFELALCNPWEYFVTLTLSPEKGNRADLDEYKRSLAKWINNLNFRNGWHIKYLLIPEPHKDGAWHMHGLFMGIPSGLLRPFSIHDHLPYHVLALLRQGRKIMNWPGYADKFGYVTCERIRDFEATAKYITKYVTKELGQSASRLNKKLYFCSHGLNRAETICRGSITKEFEPDFCNEYVAVKSFDNLEDSISYFAEDNFIPSVYVAFNDLIEKFGGGVSVSKLCPA